MKRTSCSSPTSTSTSTSTSSGSISSSSSPTKRLRTHCPPMTLFQSLVSQAATLTEKIDWSKCENTIAALDEITMTNTKDGWICGKCTFHNPSSSSSWCSSCCSSRIANASSWTLLCCNMTQYQQLYREGVEEALPEMVDDICGIVAEYVSIYMQPGHRIDVQMERHNIDGMTNAFSITLSDWRTARITSRLDGILAYQQLVTQRTSMMTSLQHLHVVLPEIPQTPQEIEQMSCVHVVMDGTVPSPASEDPSIPSLPHGEWIMIKRYVDDDDMGMSHLTLTSSSSDSDEDNDEYKIPTITAYIDDIHIYPSRLAPYGSHTFVYYDKLKHEAIQARLSILTEMGYPRHVALSALKAVGEGVVVGHQNGTGCDVVCIRNAITWLTEMNEELMVVAK